jgi:dethiobiotin synthetase
LKNNVIFVTGIGTGVGKTIASAILTEALQADYWKPVQSGLEDETDTERVRSLVTNNISRFHPEAYRLQTPASPHISAKIDNVEIQLSHIVEQFKTIHSADRYLIIEGAGGLMVPITPDIFFADLIHLLEVPVAVVTNQYLGSINHTLLTNIALRAKNIKVVGWIFNTVYITYENDFLRWIKAPKIGRIPEEEKIDKAFISKHAQIFRPQLEHLLTS